jgi:hypothetical protein
MRESTIQKSILDYLKLRGDCWFTRLNSGKIQTAWRSWVQLAPKGSPDIIVCYQSKFISFEVKKPKEKQDPEQKKSEDKIKRSGGYYFVVRSVGEVKEIFKEWEAIKD